MAYATLALMLQTDSGVNVTGRQVREVGGWIPHGRGRQRKVGQGCSADDAVTPNRVCQLG
jgi:hypothetical protein